MKKKNRDYRGSWFIKDDSTRLDGILTIDYSNFTQTLVLYSKSDFNGLELGAKNARPQHKYDYIYGETNQNNITLFDCSFSSASFISKNLYKIKYRIRCIFDGRSYVNINKDKILNLTCNIPFLSSFYDTHKPSFGSHFQAQTPLDDFKPGFSENERLDKIEINEDLNIYIERVYQPQSTVFHFNEVSNKMSHLVHFESIKGEKYDKMLEYAYQFMNLVKLATGKLVYTKLISITIPYVSETYTRDRLYISQFNSVQKRNLDINKDIHQNNLLLRGGDNHYDELKSIIKKWYETYDEYSPIYNSFLETFDWFQGTDAILSKIMFHNRIANLIYALENYHTIRNKAFEANEKICEVKEKANILLNDINLEDKKWIIDRLTVSFTPFSKRMQDLVIGDKALCIVNKILTNRTERKNYIYYIKEIRNDIAHGRASSLDTRKISTLYYASLLLLLNCILENLGLNDTDIITKISSCDKYNRMISDVRFLLTR